MPPNIVLCFDGTNNEFGPNNTNVVRLVQALDRNSQRLYYDAGIGTLPDPRVFGRVWQRVSELIDLAFAKRFSAKVEAAYTYLMDYWEPDSKVFIFGFSRGAYTARVLAGMLHLMGLLSRGNHDLVPYVMRLFRSIRGNRHGEQSGKRYWEVCNSFRWTFGRDTGNDARHFPVHFLGLWDTVSSVGWAWDPETYLFTASNPSVANARHAVSIDERRAFFRQNLLKFDSLGKLQDWKEAWFPGVHSDVGGGYSEDDGALWLAAFDWMVSESMQFGLAFDLNRLNRVRNHHRKAPAHPWGEPSHESLRGFWKALEYYPKRHWEKARGYAYRWNKGRARFIPEGAAIHESALLRIRSSDYRPRNFTQRFVAMIQALDQVPPTYSFQE